MLPDASILATHCPQSKRPNAMRRCFALVFLWAAFSASTSAAEAMKVMPPASSVAGKSPSDYSAAWWQWAFARPQGMRVFDDPNGSLCEEGQKGPVWFLAGTSGNDVVKRECKVPKGKYLFFPVINMLMFSPRNRHVACAEVQAGAAANNDHLQHAIVKIDGVPVPDVARFRVRTEQCFDVFAQAKYIDDPKAYAPAASDGYWLMLEPPAVGRHRLSVRANYVNPKEAYGEMIQYFDYDIEVVDPAI